MKTTSAELVIQRHDGQCLREQKDEILAVYQEAYAERLSDPFFHPARFWERVERGSTRDGFRLVTGRVTDELVGFTLGSVLPAHLSWWRGFRGDVDPELLCETGTRTFGINELMVRPGWRRRGYATALSTALLEGLPVERVTLLVRSENTAAYTAMISRTLVTPPSRSARRFRSNRPTLLTLIWYRAAMSCRSSPASQLRAILCTSSWLSRSIEPHNRIVERTQDAVVIVVRRVPTLAFP